MGATGVVGAMAQLAEQVEALELGPDGAELAEALAVQDRLAAKITAALGAFDAAELWELDGARSLGTWLSYRADLAGPDARRLAGTATRLNRLAATRDAWASGVLSGGQVRAICANLTDRTAGLFAEHEAELITAFAPLDVPETVRAMREWAARAEALTDPDHGPDEPDRSLHLSPGLDARRYLKGTFDPEGSQVIRAALHLATSPDPEGAPRSPARRRADALVDLCRWFLDHQTGHTAGRERPHLNLIADLDALEARGQGRFLDGQPLDATTLQRLACDAGIHRVITQGRSVVLDYGRATRTISPELWTSLALADGGCRAPWCDRGPEWCEAHHIVPWHQGGPTRLDNLALYCSRDHHRLHQPGWHVKLLPDRTVHHTAPDGRTHTSRPPPPPSLAPS